MPPADDRGHAGSPATGRSVDGDELPGRAISPWLDGEEPPPRPSLRGTARADVCVVGAGIIGIATACELAERGLDVAVLEAGRIGHGVTGNTTAKLSSLQGLKYGPLSSRFGRESAAAYAEANEVGIASIAGLVDKYSIDCDFRRTANFTYADSETHRDSIEEEVEAAANAGLPVGYTEETGLPWQVAAAVRCEEQAEFHPHRFVLALAAALERRGARIHERTRATGLSGGAVVAESGAVEAEHVVLATHLPFLDRGGYFARTHPERSYALAARVASEPPQGMYLSTEQPAHSIRPFELDGEALLLVGGEAHKAGQGNPADRYRALERFARERFDVASVEYRWAAHDNMSADGLPLIGRLWPFSDRLWAATGMGKWGLALGVCAGQMLADGICGREHRLAHIFTPMRLNARAALPTLISEGADVGMRLLGDRIRRRGTRDRIASGAGAVVGDGRGQRAVYRDESGRLHELSARCTHLGCIVGWNSADRSWDCPCHGSRFDPLGEVIHGPAVAPLSRLE